MLLIQKGKATKRWCGKHERLYARGKACVYCLSDRRQARENVARLRRKLDLAERALAG